MKKAYSFAGLILLTAAGSAFLTGCPSNSYTPTSPGVTNTNTFTATPTPTGPTATPTHTGTFTATATITNTPTVTATYTITNTPTVTATPTATSTPSSTPTPCGFPGETCTPTATPPSFANALYPIINSSTGNCFSCHLSGGEGASYMNLGSTAPSAPQLYSEWVGVAANSSNSCGIADYVVAGSADTSLIIQKLNGSCPDQMPYEETALSQADINEFTAWVNAGAPNN